MGFFGRMGDGIIGLFFKFMVILVALIVILLFIIGIATYWKFVIGVIIGGLFSPLLYSYIENNLQLGLPEYFFWNYGDVVESFIGSEAEIEDVKNDIKAKQKAARAELLSLDKKYENLNASFQDLKAKTSIETLTKGKKASKAESSRMRKAILMSIGDPEWVSEMREIKTEVDWSKYL